MSPAVTNDFNFCLHFCQEYFCLAFSSSHSRLSLFFFLTGLDTLTSVISCCLPSLSNTHTTLSVFGYSGPCVGYVCMHVCNCGFPRVCASVHRRVHSLSTDTHLSFHPDTPCDGFWPNGEFLIKVNHVSVSTVADDSGSYFKRHFIRYRAAVRGDKNHL